MFARVARYKIPEDSLDDAVEGFKEAVEQLRGIQGNTGGYLLVDRDNSTALTVTFWENRASLESSEVQASRLRSQAVGHLGGEIQAVDRCEVALDFSELLQA
jgi:heme-degrading monooxygenase HmoA